MLSKQSTAEADLAGVVCDGASDGAIESAEARDVASLRASRLRVWLPDELSQRQPPKWLVPGWLPERGVACLVGDSNIGKSFLMLGLCAAAAKGWDWLGLPVKQGAALYVAAEGGFGMKPRMDAIGHYRGAELAGSPCGLIDAGLDLRSSPKDAEELILAVRHFSARVQQPVKLIVLDTLARMMAGGDENSSAEMGMLITRAARIAEVTEALVVLVHHTGKDASKGARGHSSLRGAMDALIVVEKQGACCEMRLDKQRDGPVDLRLAYRLQPVSLGVRGDDLEEVSSAVAVSADTTAVPMALKLGKWQTHAFNAWRVADDPLDSLGSPSFEDIWDSAQPQLAAMGDDGDNARSQLLRAVKQLVDAEVLAPNEAGYVRGPTLIRHESPRALH
jgi:hypothetical protein